MEDWCVVETDIGNRIDVTKMRPARVKDLLTQAIDRKTWHESLHAEKDTTGRPCDRMRDMPWWYLIPEVINGHDTAIGRAAKSVVVGT